MTTSGRGQMSVAELEGRVQALDGSDTDEFVELIRLVGFDPAHDLRFGDFSGCRFERQDLRGFDFTGCDLSGSTFIGACIQGARFDCACLDAGVLLKAADYAAYLKDDFAGEPAERHRVAAARLRNLEVFREAPFAPEMVVIPAGEFCMGSDLGEAKLGRDDQAIGSEIVPGHGKRRMRLPRRFAMGRYPVTFEEYDPFCVVTQRKLPRDFGWGRDRRPVVDVSWDDAQAYVSWLNGKIGAGLYRLPSEAEWEYACRAGTTTIRWWGNSWDPRQANGAKQFEGGRTSPVGAYPANPWKLHDMIGNVREWCADFWANNVADLPEEGSPSGPSSDYLRRNPLFVIYRAQRGGSWDSDPKFLRSALRGGGDLAIGMANAGLRLCRTL